MDRIILRTAAAAALLAATAARGGEPALGFTEVTAEAGVLYEHGYAELDTMQKAIGSGVAAGDYDQDGYVDLYVVRGDIGPNLLFHNLGDGSFEEVGAAAGVAVGGVPGDLTIGPAFGDLDGDGWLDLVLGGAQDTQPRLFRNLGDGTFEEVTAASGVVADRATFSTAFGDYDRDGDLDLLQAHWGPFEQPCEEVCTQHLWRNNGDGTFTDVDLEAGIDFFQELDFSFTPNFADIDSDGWPDLILANDFHTSRIYRNDGDGTFTDVTDEDVIVINNAMGSTVGDFDNDGHLDWFVTAVYNPDADKYGNDLYRNLGDGTFERVSESAAVDMGEWGWGACLADLDNDADLDIFHVNGWNTEEWIDDLSRLFLSNGDGTFTEQAQDLGIVDPKQGRGVVCSDFDRDGDLDIFIANHTGTSTLYRNDSDGLNSFLNVSLQSRSANVHGVGARVLVTTGETTQMREIRMGSNFVSQDPSEAHFGLGQATAVDELRVEWPDGIVNDYGPQEVDQILAVKQSYDSVGLYDPARAGFYLKNVHDNEAPETQFPFGPGGDDWIPITGDWDGDGVDTVGSYRISLGEFRLKAQNGLGGGSDVFLYGSGADTLLPLAGDWDGDGIDTIGVFDTETRLFLLRNSNDTGEPDLEIRSNKNSPWIPITGDWDGDGVDNVGMYQPNQGRFQLAFPGGSILFIYGPGDGLLPVTGDWDGDGVDTIGVFNPATNVFKLRNENSAGGPDIQLGYAPLGIDLLPLAGEWN